MHPVDIAQILEEVTEKQVALVFRLLAKEEAAETFSYTSGTILRIVQKCVDLDTSLFIGYHKNTVYYISRQFF